MFLVRQFFPIVMLLETKEERGLEFELIISGQITFEALHMCEIYRISEISSTLVDAVILAGRDNAAKNWVRIIVDHNPFQFHGIFSLYTYVKYLGRIQF